jgi:hypothetical protein
MVHHEVISVYNYTKVADGYGEFKTAAPTAASNAPVWATIGVTGSDDSFIEGLIGTSNTYQLTVNWADNFNWSRNMFISTRFGLMDIEGIEEDTRKRLVKLRCAQIKGVDETGSGTAGAAGGLNVLYYTVPADAATITLSALASASVKLFFRDGIEKTVVASGVTANQVQKVGTVFSLVAGDIFVANERITILYTT